MEFKMQVARLRHALALLEPAIPKRTTLETLKYARLGEGKVVASDLDTTVLVELPEIRDTEGVCLLPYKVVRDMLRFTPGSALMSLVPRDGKIYLYVQGSGSEAAFATKDPLEYPPPPKLGTSTIGSIVDGDDLVGLLSAVAEYAAREESRPVLTGVCLTLGEPMEVAAADGFRLAVRQARTGFPGGEGRKVVVSQETVNALQKLWKLAPPPSEAPEDSPIAEIVVARRPMWMEYDMANYLLQFRFGNVTLLGKTIQGTYPNYRQLVPQNYTSRVTVYGADLERAVRQAGAVAAEAAGIIRLRWDVGRLRVKGQAADVGDVDVVIKAQAEGEGNIAFNMGYLLDYLKGKEGPVDIEATTPSAPGVLVYRGTRVVIMPMLVKDDRPPPAPAEPPAAEANASAEVEEPPEEEPRDLEEPEISVEEAMKGAKLKRRGRKKRDSD